MLVISIASLGTKFCFMQNFKADDYFFLSMPHLIDQRLPETGVGPDYKGQKEIFGLTEMFHILIMVIVM